MRGIFETIRQYHMIDQKMRVVAGVSGGADSVCLLYVLCEYRRQTPFELYVVHVEHGLRGEESLADARFTQELCGKLGVPCRVVPAQVERVSQEEGISVEEAGRRERYRIFREIKEECAAQRIAVAHNQNDQAETVLWNLARGSGLRGLGGMSPVRDDIIRPLLFTSRERIEQILAEAGLGWRTDRTNLQQDYTRNRIRLSILPQMERELNTRAAEHIADAAGRLKRVQEYLDLVTDSVEEQCIRRERDSVCVSLQALRAQDGLIQEELLRRAVSLCGGLRDFGDVHLRALLHLCTLDCGREISLPGRLRAVREAGILRLCPAQENDLLRLRSAGKADVLQTHTAQESDLSQLKGKNGAAWVNLRAELSPGTEVYEIKVPEAGKLQAAQHEPGLGAPEADAQTQAGEDGQSGSLCICGWSVRYEFLENSRELMGQIVEKKYTKWLSCDTINDDVLSLRTRKPGDYLIVNRDGGRKKLKDYLIDQKIPREQRDRLLLLTAGPYVLWVVGQRISEAAKVTEDTKRVLRVQVEEVLKVQAEEGVHEGKDTDPADGAGSQ